MSHPGVRPLVLTALALAAVVVGILALRGSGGAGHRVSFVVPAATGLMSGQAVRAATGDIGRVTRVDPVDRGRAARVSVRIDDGRYWPLPTDSSFEARFGGTVSFSNRYLLLRLGHATATIPDEGQVAADHVKSPVEIDALLQTFKPVARANLRRMFDLGGPALARARPAIHLALQRTPTLLDTTTSVIRDFSADQQTLGTLLTSTSHVVDAVDRSAPDVRTLLDGAAATFDGVASQSQNLEATLQRMPAALTQARETLGRADGTLASAGKLTDTLKPGVVQLQRIAAPVDALLAGVRGIAPDAETTLRTAQSGAPAVTALLGRVGDLAPTLGSIGHQATTQVGCLRPYTPEAAQFFTTWGDWLGHTDTKDHVARATVQNYLPAQFNSSTLTPGEAKQAYPGLAYGFPRPPGDLAGQDWFQPQCGVGPSTIDPAQDPEALHKDPSAAPPTQDGSR